MLAPTWRFGDPPQWRFGDPPQWRFGDPPQRPFAYPVAVSLSHSERAFPFWM